jgi:hypothetical protein
MSLTDFSESRVNPLEVVERVATTNSWSFERAGDDEITILVTGKWTDYQVSYTWMFDIEALHLACAFELKVPERCHGEVQQLIALINEQYGSDTSIWTQDIIVITATRCSWPAASGVRAAVQTLLRALVPANATSVVSVRGLGRREPREASTPRCSRRKGGRRHLLADAGTKIGCQRIRHDRATDTVLLLPGALACQVRSQEGLGVRPFFLRRAVQGPPACCARQRPSEGGSETCMTISQSGRPRRSPILAGRCCWSAPQMGGARLEAVALGICTANVVVFEPHRRVRSPLTAGACVSTRRPAHRRSGALMLAIKPQTAPDVMPALQVASARRCGGLDHGGAHAVSRTALPPRDHRAMPNTPAAIGAGSDGGARRRSPVDVAVDAPRSAVDGSRTRR